MDRTTSTLLSPREAARHLGCGRSSIMRALAAKTLPATRGNDNGWLIRPEDLDRWSTNRTSTGPVTVQDRGPVEVRTMSEPDQLLKRLAAAETRAETLAAEINAIRTERDQAHLEAAILSVRVEAAEARAKAAEAAFERQHDLLAAAIARPVLPPPTPSLLDRLLGRIRRPVGVPGV